MVENDSLLNPALSLYLTVVHHLKQERNLIHNIDEIIIAKFFGEGHTKDNIIGYFPSDNVLFGGCLIKELDASKGYLGDANVAVWSNTVENIKKRFPDVNIVVPGHGEYGNMKLLDYTINLFKTRYFGERKLTESK